MAADRAWGHSRHDAVSTATDSGDTWRPGVTSSSRRSLFSTERLDLILANLRRHLSDVTRVTDTDRQRLVPAADERRTAKPETEDDHEWRAEQVNCGTSVSGLLYFYLFCLRPGD